MRVPKHIRTVATIPLPGVRRLQERILQIHPNLLRPSKFSGVWSTSFGITNMPNANTIGILVATRSTLHLRMPRTRSILSGITTIQGISHRRLTSSLSCSFLSGYGILMYCVCPSELLSKHYHNGPLPAPSDSSPSTTSRSDSPVRPAYGAVPPESPVPPIFTGVYARTSANAYAETSSRPTSTSVYPDTPDGPTFISLYPESSTGGHADFPSSPTFTDIFC